MAAKVSFAERLAHFLEKVSGQSGELTETAPDYGSWLLGSVSESPRRRRLRIQIILTTFIIAANLVGIGVASFLVVVAFPVPSIFDHAPLWINAGVAPAYVVVALVAGTWWGTRRVGDAVRWAIDERAPTPDDQRHTLLAPWYLTVIHLVLWGVGTVLLTALYGMVHHAFIPRYLLAVGFSGLLVATASFLAAEFALRPVAAQVLEAGHPPMRFAPGIASRVITVWMLGSGIPVLGIILAAVFSLSMRNLTQTQFTFAVLVLGLVALVVGFILMWIAAWLIGTPVQVVRAALKRVEQGDLNTRVVVFDGTQLGELQRGFNSMVHGLRERERVRDLFGRHVGREVAAAAERGQVKLGGEEVHVAVVFVDVIGSTQLAASLPPMQVVDLLNRFFAVVVTEVDRHDGLLNKFEGDASLAVFGAPVQVRLPEDAALSAARAIARRLPVEVPQCPAGIGVAAGTAVAGNIGAAERFEYTVIGDPVNEGARLCEEAKSTPWRLLASAVAVRHASETERAHWVFGDEVVLRGRNEPTALATPAGNPPRR